MVSYAVDFLSYLLSEKYMEKHSIRNVILYGSVAKGDFNEKSDVDVFVDVQEPEELAEKVKQTVKDFYGSIWFKKWSRFGVNNPISVIVGNLEEWEDLKRSMISGGILLYGHYSPHAKGRPMTLLAIGTVKQESKRVFLNRKLFGYNRYGRRYAGLVEKYGGEKLGKGCFAVPMEYSKEVLDLLRKYKVPVKIHEFMAM